MDVGFFRKYILFYISFILVTSSQACLRNDHSKTLSHCERLSIFSTIAYKFIEKIDRKNLKTSENDIVDSFGSIYDSIISQNIERAKLFPFKSQEKTSNDSEAILCIVKDDLCSELRKEVITATSEQLFPFVASFGCLDRFAKTFDKERKYGKKVADLLTGYNDIFGISEPIYGNIAEEFYKKVNIKIYGKVAPFLSETFMEFLALKYFWAINEFPEKEHDVIAEDIIKILLQQILPIASRNGVLFAFLSGLTPKNQDSITFLTRELKSKSKDKSKDKSECEDLSYDILTKTQKIDRCYINLFKKHKDFGNLSCPI